MPAECEKKISMEPNQLIIMLLQKIHKIRLPSQKKEGKDEGEVRIVCEKTNGEGGCRG